MACGRQFLDGRRKKTIFTKTLWSDYVFGKQTVRELAKTYGKDRRTIREYLDTYLPPDKQHRPRPVHIVLDGTYYGERTEDTEWCLVVVRDPQEQEDLVWTFCRRETTLIYSELREKLEGLGYTILSFTADGFGGIQSAFSSLPFQMCHVHMERIVTRGTTKKPKTEAGMVLLALVQTLHNTDKNTFSRRLTDYINLFRDFLNEKTRHPESGDWSWTHEDLRKATLSLQRYLPYLFTYQTNKNIPKTTNSLEGRFSHINDIAGIHRGLSRPHKQKILHSILLASTIAPDNKTLKHIL